MAAHSLLSPSSAGRWMRCHASVAAEAPYPNSTSRFAAEGTAAHEVASWALIEKQPASHYIGRVIEVDGFSFTVDEDMAEHVQTHVDKVLEIAAEVDGDLFVEQRVDFGRFTGVPDSFGTSDAVILSGDGEEIIVVDLKYGMGVRVDAGVNPQLMIYALGAYDQFAAASDFKTVRMAITQPRLGHYSQWSCSTADLLAFGEEVRIAADKASGLIGLDPLPAESFAPSESACRFCRARGDCEALTIAVAGSVLHDHARGSADDLVDLDEEHVADAIVELAKVEPLSLSRKMAMVGMVEDWCLAVRARVEAELFAGREVEGYKLVQGRKGARSWIDPETVAFVLDANGVPEDVIYDRKVISPATVDKLIKRGDLSADAGIALAEHITQSPGTPSVAPAGDKRPALDHADRSGNLVDLDGKPNA